MNPWLSRCAVIAVARPACRPSPLVTAPVTTSGSTPAEGSAGRGRTTEDSKGDRPSDDSIPDAILRAALRIA